MGVRAVYLVQGTNRTPVPRLDESRKAGLLSQAGVDGSLARYEILQDTTGTVVRFYPAVSGTFEVEYIAEPVAWTADSDTWNGPARSDELICLHAAAKACRKEGRRGDAADLLQDYAQLLEQVLAAASWVDMRNPPTIRDVMTEARRGDAFDYLVSGPDSI